MKQRRHRLSLAEVGLCGLMLAAVPNPAFGQAAGPPAATPGPTTVLLEQARYWLAHGQPAAAEAAIGRALLADPGSAEALAMLTRLEVSRGEQEAAAATLARLRAAHPDDPRLAALAEAVRAGPIDPGLLGQARRLAADGQAVEAVQRYQEAFHGTVPPPDLAVEYYQTLAGTEGGWDAATAGLARLLDANPGNLRAQLAFATLLTDRAGTREAGIARLAALAADPANTVAADAAWRQALLWLPVDGGSVGAYRTWLAAHPDDPTMVALLTEAEHPVLSPAEQAGRARVAGFAALQAGRLADAASSFQAALKVDPHDGAADGAALGGLGLVRLRQGDMEEARGLLARAIAADPAAAGRWQAALAGADVGAEYARAKSLIAAGELAAAARQLRAIIAQGGDVSGGDVSGAELMLAGVLRREGHGDAAASLLARAGAAGGAQQAGPLRAQLLRRRAAAASDPGEKLALLNQAVAADPADPWTRLDLARALEAAGQDAEAEQMMAAVTGVAEPSADALQAGAIFAAENHRPAEAAALVARLPPAARTPEMQSIAEAAALSGEIRAALALAPVNPGDARRRLLALAARPDPEGARGAAIARAFLRMGDPFGAREALATAQAATPAPTAAQLIAYAGVLLEAGRTADAAALVASVGDAADLSAQQSAALDQLRAGIAVTASDALDTEGRTADAYDALAPALRESPEDPALNLALGRLYQSADEPGQALAIDTAVLARNPDDMAARQAAIGAAIQAGQWRQAALWVGEATERAPNDPGAWLAAASFARAQGDSGQALADLQTARSLRLEQLGAGGGLAGPVPADPPGTTIPGTNPFRGAATSPGAAGTGTPADPTLAEIDRQIAALDDQVSPKLSFGGGIRTRSGTPGLDQLLDATTPIEASFSPDGRGTLHVTATPTFLTAGQLAGGASSQAQFGTAALGGSAVPQNQQAAGVGLDIAFAEGWFAADAGVTPLGFAETNAVGGVTLSPLIADNLRLRITAERRAVTDSVLSYAGTSDPNSGTSWGGVTRSGGHLQLEFSAGPANFYVGGGYDWLAGSAVASNEEGEFGAGGSLPVWQSGSDAVRVGLDLVYFGYQKNLRYFSLGQGGYFSPQSYFAAVIPVNYQGSEGDLSWSVGGSLGFQTYDEAASDVFPDNPALQDALVARAASTPGLATTYASDSNAGVVGGAHGELTYRVSRSLELGGRASYQRTGDWNTASGLFFARYIFNGAHQ